MRKRLLRLAALCFISVSLKAQGQKNIAGLIAAEKSFAAYSVSHNMNEAFIKFLDSNGVVFEKGQAVNGLETWAKKEVQPGILNWHPQFAEIASSGDFGYTTGPWTYQPKTVSDSVVARGQYTTVWGVTKGGEWKFLVDLGVSNLPSTDSSEARTFFAQKISTASVDLKSMVQAEDAFIKAFKKNPSTAYTPFLSEKTILNRNGHLPGTTPSEFAELIASTPASMNFTIHKSVIATSGDLGYVYGTATNQGKTDNYLHIWRREKGGWKLALEVLRY